MQFKWQRDMAYVDNWLLLNNFAQQRKLSNYLQLIKIYF